MEDTSSFASYSSLIHPFPPSSFFSPFYSPSPDPNSSFPLYASLKVYVPHSDATVLHHFMPPL